MHKLRHPIAMFVVPVLLDGERKGAHDLPPTAGDRTVLLTRASSSLSTTGVCPKTAAHLGSQEPQPDGAPIGLVQASISLNVSAQTF